MCRSEMIIDELMLEELKYLRLKYSISSTNLITDDISSLSFTSFKL